ncbi:MAG: flagellar assembly protein FliW [Lentisphaerales bacterium]|nr:flagellar assembly protein FliW [Lentisphaerales bacterium]
MSKKKNNVILGLTPYQGEMLQSLEKEAVISFPEGVPAFEDAKSFTLVTTDEIKPFLYLKSLEIDELGFVCIDPFLIQKDYLVKITAADLAHLGLKDPKDALVFCFVTVKEDPKDNTANLLAPIVVNLQNRTGRQIILDNYPVRLNIWESLDAMGDE